VNGDFSKITKKPIDMFPRTDTIKNDGPQTSIQAARATLRR